MLYKNPVTLLLLAVGLLPSVMAATLKAREEVEGHWSVSNDINGGCQLNSDGRIFSCTYGSVGTLETLISNTSEVFVFPYQFWLVYF